MAQKLFSTGPGGFKRAKRKEIIDDLERTSCDNLFHSEMVLGKKITLSFPNRPLAENSLRYN